MFHYISLFCIVIGLLQILICLLFTIKTKNIPNKKIEVNAKFCILIPARNESKVIENLLVSITKQTYEVKPDVYVIVEEKTDPTINICKKYQMNYFIRTEIEGRRRKGYALDEVLKQIRKEYDAYIIVDADNILDKNFLKEMNETYKLGYDIGVGYRNCKNGNTSVIAATSALTFSMINTLSNKARFKKNKNITISGTGFFINGEWIKKWNGYPFHSLTEDYELSLYATLNNMTSAYNENAIFYDEQPLKYKESIKQRTRWVKGYFESRKRYVPLLKNAYKSKNVNRTSQYQAIVGVKPYIWIVMGLALSLLKECLLLVYFVINEQKTLFYCIRFLFILLGSIYGFLFLFTFFLLLLERKKINLSFTMKIKALFFNPIFLSTYVYCALKAALKKEIGWDVIVHTSKEIY